MRGSSPALLLALLSSAGAGATEPLRPSPSAADEYAETFTFIADVEGGFYLQLQLAVTNVGPGRGHAFCRVLVAGGGEKAWSASRLARGRAWTYVPGPPARLGIDGCEASAESDATRVRAQVDGGAVELVFAAPPHESTPPDDALQIGGGRHVTRILHQRTPVTATVRRPGAVSPVRLQGGGYADHSRSEVAPKALAKKWIRFRALGTSERVLLLAREALDGAFRPAWMWPAGATPRPLERFAVVRREGTEPSFSIGIDRPGAPPATLRTTALLYRLAPVEELGVLGRLARTFVGSPVTYTFRAVLERPESPPVAGILEVSLASEP